MTPKCAFDERPAVDRTAFDAGNNAETLVRVDICAACESEMEADEFAFQDKHAGRLNQIAAESSIADRD